MNTVTNTVATLLIILTPFSIKGADDKLPEVRIGTVSDGPWIGASDLETIFSTEINNLLAGEFDVSYPPARVFLGDWNPSTISNFIDTLLADTTIDLVIGYGVIASQDLCGRSDLPKPVFAPFVIDQHLQGVPIKKGASGVKNLSYLTAPFSIGRDIKSFNEVLPIKRLAVLVNDAFLNAVEGLRERVIDQGKANGMDITVVGVGASANAALAQIPEGVDGVYVAVMAHLDTAEFQKIIEYLNEQKLPSFSMAGRRDVLRGIMVGMAPENEFERVARRLALNIQRVLLGEEAGSLPVFVAEGRSLTLNMATIRSIGVWPRWEVITEAELIDDERKDLTETVSLYQAVNEAIAANLDFAASARKVAAGRAETAKARSNLLPRVDISTSGLIIDEDRAQASLGQQAERTLTGQIDLSQVLYSESAWSNLSIQGQIQKARQFNHDQARLDLVQQAATAYLNVLRTKTLERIQRDNYRVTRSNLELARVRQRIGFSGPAEVLRWESQIASNRISLISSNSQRNVAEIELNRLLNRPLEENLNTLEIGLNDPELFSEISVMLEYMGDPLSFRQLRAFFAEYSLENSPELKQLEAQVNAERRNLSSKGAAFWSPTVALSGSVSSMLTEGGAGSGSGSFFDSIPGLSGNLPESNDLDWTIGVNVSLPLFTSGLRTAERRQANERLLELRLLEQSTRQRVEQAVRSALHINGASYAAIRLSQQAASASDSTLTLVTDAYSRGAVPIIDLIDAQNASLTSEQQAANAVYNFLIDLYAAERAFGEFDFLRSDEERQEFNLRMIDYMENAKSNR